MRLRIESQFPILNKEKGNYHAFPTIIRQGGQLWLACRSGLLSDHQDHGKCGKVLLFSSDTEHPDRWHCTGTLFAPTPGGTGNELDAILSNPEPTRIFLATRDYERDQRNDVYFSVGSTPVLRERRLLRSISDQDAICFGHIRKSAHGELLMPGYCGFEDEPVGTPVLLVSKDRGRTWSLRSKVASSTAVGTRLTEYSLGCLGGANWVALLRNETPPFNLYRASTHDDGHTWSVPEKTSLFGHAPMILDAEDSSGHLVIYRDLSASDPGVAIGWSAGHGENWQNAGRLATYTGSIYDGGYGDLIQVGSNRYLAVYYLCDADASPWIEGCIFSME